MNFHDQLMSVEATVYSDKETLKKMLSTFFANAKLFAKIKHTSNGVTKVIIQGHPKQLNADLESLKIILFNLLNADVEYGVQVPVDSTNKLESVIIEETDSDLKRMGSSGEFNEKEFDEISFNGSCNSEQLKKLGKTIAQSIIDATSALGRTTGLIPLAKEKHITLKDLNKLLDLEVSRFLNLEKLMEAVNKKFGSPTIPINRIYREQDNDAIEVTDITDLKDGETYYVLNINEEFPTKKVVNFSTMEEFFEKLKSEQELDEDEIKIIKDVFDAQKIKVMNLKMITDEELKGFGCLKDFYGLRMAILAVIYPNSQSL